MIRLASRNSKQSGISPSELVIFPVEGNEVVLSGGKNTLLLTKDNIGEAPFHYFIDAGDTGQLYAIGSRDRLVTIDEQFSHAKQARSGNKLYIGISVKNVSKIDTLETDLIQDSMSYILSLNFPPDLFDNSGSTDLIKVSTCLLKKDRQDREVVSKTVAEVIT